MYQNEIALILCFAGMTWGLTRATALEFARILILGLGSITGTRQLSEDMLACPFCTGFWVGLIGKTFIYALNPPDLTAEFSEILFRMTLTPMLFGFGVAIVAMVFDSLITASDMLAQIAAGFDDEIVHHEDDEE